MLDHVAYADDPSERAVLEHRQMAKPAIGHGLHQLFQPVLRDAGHHLDGHQLADPHLHQLGPVVGQATGNVALRDDAREPAAVIGDHHRTDALGLEQAYNLGNGRLRPGSDHLAALGRENLTDQHGTAPPWKPHLKVLAQYANPPSDLNPEARFRRKAGRHGGHHATGRQVQADGASMATSVSSRKMPTWWKG